MIISFDRIGLIEYLNRIVFRKSKIHGLFRRLQFDHGDNKRAFHAIPKPSLECAFSASLFSGGEHRLVDDRPDDPGAAVSETLDAISGSKLLLAQLK